MSRFHGLDVAGLRLAVEAPDSLPWEWPEGPLRRFAAPPVDADCRVHVRVGRPRLPRGAELVYDSQGGIFDVARLGGDWIVALRIRGRLERLARFDDDFREGVVVIDPASFYAKDRHYPLAYPLDELVFLHRLAREGGLLVHSCGVERDGCVRLFTGPSGAGKTTLARLMLEDPGCAVLSDDRMVVRRDAEGFRAFGTPWHGDAPLAEPRGARLTGIHAIRKTPGFEARPLAAATAAAAVLGNAFLPAHDRCAAERTLALIEALVDRVEIAELGFCRDPGVSAFVWRRGVPAAA